MIGTERERIGHEAGSIQQSRLVGWLLLDDDDSIGLMKGVFHMYA